MLPEEKPEAASWLEGSVSCGRVVLVSGVVASCRRCRRVHIEMLFLTTDHTKTREDSNPAGMAFAKEDDLNHRERRER
jgi:hypothetical protein